MSTSSEPSRHQPPRYSGFAEKLVRVSEFFVVAAAGLLVIVAVVVSTGVLYALFIHGLRTNLAAIGTIDALQTGVQHVFAGVLLLMLGLELLETLKTYFKDYHFRTEVILVVAIIAVGRHIIQIDFEHTTAAVLLGTAALMVALAVSYFLVRVRRSDALIRNDK
jgi:uncharacterized membrane protein (DUF373 family)